MERLASVAEALFGAITAPLRRGTERAMVGSKAIPLPHRLEAAGRSWRSCIDTARRIATEADADVIDARRLDFAMPFGITMIASAAIQRAANGLAPLAFVPPDSAETRAFLDEIEFPMIVEQPHEGGRSGNPLSIRRLSSSSLDPTFTESVARTMEALVPGTSESVAYNVKLSLNELLQNVTEHSESHVDCVVHARWYALQQSLRLSVSDAGIGLVASLQRNPALADLFDDDGRLVAHALTVPGVTGRTSGKFGGFGLKSLRDFVVRRGGVVSVATGIVFARVDGAGAHAEFGPRLRGTTIELDFRPLPDDGSRAEEPTEDFF